MNNLKKAAAVTLLAGGIAMAGAGAASASSISDGGAKHSPGVVSGNNTQVPVHIPVNVSGNTTNVVGAANPAFANTGLVS